MSNEETKLPALDTARIAKDEARGIKFSEDKRTLINYNNELPDILYMVPNGVTDIGFGAFLGSLRLKRIILPESVTSIERLAFNGCTRLFEVNIPDGVTSIGEKAFEECFDLTDISLPDGVTSIGDGAFDGCGRVACSANCNYYTDEVGALFDRKTRTLLHFPSDFSGTYTLPDGVTRIGERAFWQCDGGLTHVNIPASVTSIGKDAFSWCGGLTDIDIPNGVTNIEDGAFSACSNLTHVVLPEGLKSIGACAFFNCGKLAAVTVPESVTSIGELALPVSRAE